MANPEHVKILKQGVEVWNRWREENPDLKPNLLEADLSSMKLKHINLSNSNCLKSNFHRASLIEGNLQGANLGNASMVEVSLVRANLQSANLRRADFLLSDLTATNLRDVNLRGSFLIHVMIRDADLRCAKMQGADLSYANFSGSDLSAANLNGANLRETDFTGVGFYGTYLYRARVTRCKFCYVDLSKVLGINSIQTGGPSTIGIDTIFRSHGKISDVFLRRTGVPETFINYVKSLKDEELNYHSCFISYSSKNQDFAERLYADLQKKGVRCWFAPEDMKIGDKIRDKIDQSIRIHDKLLLVLSEHSINSEWVEDEVEAAYEQERQRGKTVLFPIRLDPAVMDTGKAWAAKLRRSRHIGDFTHWKDHDVYKKALDRLMRDLRAEEPAGSD